MKISAVILAKNEEKNIQKAVQSVLFCDEIIIVDDESNDKTIGIIEKLKLKYGNKPSIKILHRLSRADFASQRNWAMTQTLYDWTLFLDADEEVGEELQKEIAETLNSQNNSYSAYYLKRRDFFWSHEMKWGEVLSVRNYGLIRLMKKGAGEWKGTVHEEFCVKENSAQTVGRLNSFINHYPHQTVAEFLEKVNIYSSIRSEELKKMGKSFSLFDLIIYPTAKFILNYFLYLGFLDGPAGFVYAFFMSFHSFLVRAKLYNQ